uniref:THAP-type domain-containing protein n=1 Tax=Sinocyclocheilus anshuiensis TaxID=1608454 RepID=A0A671LIE9_9TELE
WTPCCSEQSQRSLAWTLVTFHVFPTSEPARLKLWLIALRLDINTPINVLKLLRVCSDNFSPDDFTYPGEDHVRLKLSAVPMVFPHPTEVCEQDLCMCPFYL